MHVIRASRRRRSGGRLGRLVAGVRAAALLGGVLSVGLDLTGPAAPLFRRGHLGVYSPTGGLIAFVRNVPGRPVIYRVSPFAGQVRLTAGSQPDWQPVAPAPTQQAEGGA